ncbi:MAG: hypothetical protein HYV04_08465 [Deltaproteobacteria bacterium]|nr:hypothetical protein [Deltaproteobacteria bacterium]
MSEISFVDTTLRDGHQSLWAEGMTTGMMLPIAERMDQAGFEAMELISGSHLKKCVRELKEDPWERVRLVAKRITKTPLRVIAGRVNTFGFNPLSMYRVFLERMAANGIRQARISEEWNDFSGWQRKVQTAREVGLEPIVNLIFSISPKHSDEYYARKTREAASLGVPRLCTGLGPLCCLEAIKLGIKSINTAIPPLANSASNPSVFNIARNARALGYTPAIDEAVVKPVVEHFTFIAKREGFPTGMPVEYDYSQYLHQVPGGMISNLGHQLRRVGLQDRLEEALKEAVRVRADFGYPSMVTPLSQYVGSQAAINVIVGERYKEVTDQVIKYALGQCGEEGSSSMDPDVKDRILDRPRAKELARWEPYEPSVEDLRSKLGGPGVSDEELLLRWLLTKDEIEAMRAAGAPKEYLSGTQPVVALIEELAKRSNCSQIRIQRPDLSLILEKRPDTSKGPSTIDR